VPRTRRTYPPEFKRDAIELARRSSQSVARTANDLGVDDQTLRNWIKQAEIDEGKTEGLTTDELAELRELRRENRKLKMEREILKKAAVNSTRHRNAASSVAAGVLNPSVFLGRVFSLRAIVSS
jgi:transposase